MAGHSQYANIKHRKDAQDAKRAKKFLRVSREISVAIKLGGIEADKNPRLRLALEKARLINMPKDNIERIFSKYKNNAEQENYHEIIYEGYGPGNVAFIIRCLTDSVNRTAGAIRSYFTRNGGNLGSSNSVLYLFELKSILKFEDHRSFEEIQEILLDSCATNCYQDIENNQYVAESSQENLFNLQNDLSRVGIQNILELKREFVAFEKVKVENPDNIKMLENLIDALENDPDVQEITSNWEK